MSVKTLIASTAGWVLKTVGGATGSIAGTPIGDIKTGAQAIAAVLLDIEARKLSLKNGVALANAIQNLLVDEGVEPKLVAEGLALAGVALPLLEAAWRAAGVNPFTPMPRGGPPIAAADWSHGFPQPQPVDNPSGAIGGTSNESKG